MVIVGGSGNNFGAILGGFVVWFLWIEAAPIGLYLVNLTTAGLEDTHFLKSSFNRKCSVFQIFNDGNRFIINYEV